jgi:hypothetical protein
MTKSDCKYKQASISHSSNETMAHILECAKTHTLSNTESKGPNQKENITEVLQYLRIGPNPQNQMGFVVGWFTCDSQPRTSTPPSCGKQSTDNVDMVRAIVECALLDMLAWW